MAVVECEDTVCAVATGENYDRGVGQADVEIGIGLDDATSTPHVGCIEQREFVRPRLNLLEERLLSRGTDVAPDHAVELGKNER